MSLPRTLINFAAFQAGWFACVAGAAHGLPWLGPLLVLPVAGWHLANADRPADELRFMLVATALGMGASDFVAAHNAKPLRVLATGFAPGFVYCGLHAERLVLPRRTSVRPSVPAGSVLFAAGQTAIAATEMPTGWHVIGHTDFRNFDPAGEPPTRLGAGDVVTFEAMP